MAGFNFEDELGGLDDASLMDVLGYPTTSPAAPAPSPVVSAPAQAPAPLFSYVAPAAAPTPVSQPPQGLASLVQAAPAPQPAFVASPVSAPAPSPFGMSLDQIAGDGFDTLTGSDLGISAPAAQAPAAQAPAPSPSAAPVPQQGYNPYSGELSPALLKLMPTSGADIYGKWQFDTQADRANADYQAQYGFNPESGQASAASYTGTPKYTYTEPEYDPNGNLIKAAQPTGLDPRYNLKDTSGLVHGSKTVWVDPTHQQTTFSFFDPKTGKQVGDQIQETRKVEQSWSDKLADIGMALASAAITGGTLGGQLFNVAKAADTGNTLGALAGALGVAGGAGDILGSDVASAAQLGQKAIGAGTALASGDPLRMLGAAANLTGNEDLAAVSKAANTAALVNAAAQGNTGAIINLLASGAPTVFNAITGGAGAMTSGEEEERKGASETYDLLKQLPDNKATTNAVETILKGQDTTVGSGDDLTGGISNDDLDALLGTGLTGAGTTSGAGTTTGGETSGATTGDETKGGETAGAATGDEQTGGTLLDQLRNAGVDTGTEGTSTGYTGEDIEGAGLTEGEDEERKGADETLDYLKSLGYTDTSGEDEDRAGVASILGDMTEGEAEDRASVSDVLADLGDYGLTDREAEDRAGVSDVLSDLGGYGMTDREAEDRAAVKDIIDKFGYTPGTGGGTGGETRGGTPTKTTKPTTPTKTTTAQSGLDLNSLMALMALMGGGEQAPAPQQQLFNLGQRKSLQDIFKDYYA